MRMPPGTAEMFLDGRPFIWKFVALAIASKTWDDVSVGVEVLETLATLPNLPNCDIVLPDRRSLVIGVKRRRQYVHLGDSPQYLNVNEQSSKSNLRLYLCHQLNRRVNVEDRRCRH